MLKKKNIILSFIILCSAIVGTILCINNNLKHVNSVSMTDFDDIKDNYASFENENGLFSVVAPLENTYSDYYTMYCNLLRDNLKIQINKKALSKKLIDLMSSDFKDTDKISNNVFEGIEQPYYLYILNKNLNLNLPLNNMKDIVSHMINESYREDGYFLPSFYKEDTSISTKLSITLQTLEVAKELQLMDTIDKKAVINWTQKILESKDLILADYYYLTQISNVLEVPLLTDSQIRTLLEQQQVEKWNADDLVDVIEMQAYVFLCKQFNLSNEDKINLILSNIKNSLRIDIREPQILSRKVELLGEYNVEIDTYFKDKIDFLTKINKYDDETYPVITSYEEDLKQAFMVKEIFNNLGERNIAFPNEAISRFENSIQEQDLYDLYSIIKLKQEFGTQNDITDQIVERIKKERIETLNENNITTWGWQMLILKECGYKIEPGDLPGNINQIIDSIKNLTKPFNNNLLNLILIDTLITIDLNDDKQIYSDFVKQINVSDASEVLCYDVYYKNIILHRLGEFDASDIEHFAKTLRRKGGFSMNKKQVFPDIRSTYLMMQLLNLKGEGKNYDTKR